jgi:hypothetical protein
VLISHFSKRTAIHLGQKRSQACQRALSKLGLVIRSNPMTATVAKLIVELAKNGERDPKKCVTRTHWPAGVKEWGP